MATEFTKESLPAAVQSLFELNQYTVEGPRKVHGAEVDLIARSKSNVFAPPIYIEVTVEYVDNDKYGKDVGKLAMVREDIERDAQLLIVSSKGFSLPVRERANKTRIRTLTYTELFRSFERFEPYVELFLGSESPRAKEIISLDTIYEEPFFEDTLGAHKATAYLHDWRLSSDPKQRWLVVLGEYGTGKTALTRILQYRWLREYVHDSSKPIPFRIELRDFTRQFDARGLVHHFLDSNRLPHLPLDFVMSLIRTGRVVLILDGYDEMAQYLHARERRTCLEALAELSADGARGILTSRPNYFTEGEELQVFETLYTRLQQSKYYLGASERARIEQERRVDQLLEQFIERFERTLRDLTPEQTEALVDRALAHDEPGRVAVRTILSRIFRTGDEGASVSLSGKPVIVTYLLQVVEELTQGEGEGQGEAERFADEELNEWQVYKLIVDLLMLRDLFQRSSMIAPDERRNFLHLLSVFLSQKDNPVVGENEFKDLIAKVFSAQLRRLENRPEELERLFADLRSSATLTRAEDPSRSGWRFSHNSLREFLLAEHLLLSFRNGTFIDDSVPITDTMRIFAAASGHEEVAEFGRKLAAYWGQRSSHPGIGRLLTLLWDGLCPPGGSETRGTCLTNITGRPAALNRLVLSRLTLSSLSEPSDLGGANCADSELYQLDFSGALLQGADFSRSVLEEVKFVGADLSGASMAQVFAIDIDISDAILIGADFRRVKAADISVIGNHPSGDATRRRFEGIDALGYIRRWGALVDRIPIEAVLRHHPSYEIVNKVLDRLAEQSVHQRRGIEQRGAAAKDVPFARALVDQLLRATLLSNPRGNAEFLETTEAGRGAFKRFVETGQLPEPVINLLRRDDEETWSV